MTQEETRTLELRDYLRLLRRHKWIIAVTMVVCLAAALAMSLVQSPVYSASTKVLLDQRLIETIFLEPIGNQPSNGPDDRQRGNEIQVMGSPKVRALVGEKLGRTPEGADFIPVEGTDVVEIVVRGENAKRTAQTANAFAATYIEVRRDLTVTELEEAAKELQAQITDLDTKIAAVNASLAVNPPAPQVQGRTTPTDPRVIDRDGLDGQRNSYAAQLETVQVGVSVTKQGGADVLSKASPPVEPINQNPVRNGIAGLAIGIVLAIALAFLREYLDDTVKTKEDLESASGLTVVGLIPVLADWKNRERTQLISVAQPRSPAAEAYRTVRTSVEFLGLDQPIGSIQVTSAMASEGKTTTLANLAVTFARSGQRVIILCCDLRRPRIHEFFGLTNRVGFTSMLLGDVPVSEAIQSASRELPIGLVASGPLPPNPAELLASKRAVEGIEALDNRCDLLLIDSPPVLPVTDALVISGLVDGVLLVSGSDSSTKRGVKRAVELLHQVDAPLIGGILNGVHSKSGYGYVYGDNRYYLDGAKPDEKKVLERRNGRRPTRVSTRASR